MRFATGRGTCSNRVGQGLSILLCGLVVLAFETAPAGADHAAAPQVEPQTPPVEADGSPASAEEAAKEGVASPGEGAESAPPSVPPAPAVEKSKEKPGPYTSRAWGTRVEPEPPGYVKPLSESGLPGAREADWFDFGLIHRTRFEMRRDDYRRGRDLELPDEDQFLLRTQMYMGVRKILDPFRFGLEVEDARQFNSDFEESADDVNELDFIQAFGELYFEDALGKGQPLSLRAGRMTLEYMDRRLVGRNRWRSSINTFDGFRLRLGEPRSDWQFDFFAVQPVERRLYSRDVPDEERWFYGLIGSWRRWSPHVILEPYYLILDEDRKDETVRDRTLHTMGLYTYGLLGKSGFDYDANASFQFGEDGERDICAYAFIGELGYSFQHAWKPRLSFVGSYASGDRDPNDNKTERFDRLFEVGHPWSTSDLFDWRNMIEPKLRLELRPHEKIRLMGAYGAYWLASDNDAWPRVGRRDATGDSGDYVGQELELQLRWQVEKRIELELGYAHFMPGDFVKNTGPADDADFFYVQTTLQF